MPVLLSKSERSLAVSHDVALLDLDGVVYIGASAVPGAPAALQAARDAGMRLAFVTNNAARPPYVVADHLSDLGIPAESGEVITSSQAAARYLADRLPGGARILVLGTTGLTVALEERGLTPVSDASGRVDAVVQGFSPDMDWRLLAEGAVAINSGVLWVATNVDPTVPSERGRLPGNGSLVAALRLATGRDPVVTGKPDPTMHRETLLRTKAERPLVVGDRLDTDIEGARAVGCDSLLVLSGVTTPADLLAAVPRHRPEYLGADVSALLVRHEAPRFEGSSTSLGGWSVASSPDALTLSGGGDSTGHHGDGAQQPAGPDRHLDALRALVAAAWRSAGEQADSAYRGSVRADGPAARAELTSLGLA